MSNSNYETSDFGLSTALLTAGSELVGVNKDNPKRVVFEFTDSLITQETIEKYWNGELRLNVLRFFENSKILKSRIYGA